MMSRSCVLPNCTSSDPSRSYFPFPHNVVLRQLWLEACGLTTITEDQFVCRYVTRSMRMFSILFSTIKVSFFLCNKFAPYLVFKHFLQMLFLRIFKFSHCIETGKSTYISCYYFFSDHFTVSDFTCSRTKTELLPEAVPNASNLAPPNKATSAYILEHLEHQTDNEFVSDLCGGEESDSPAAKIKPFWKNTDPEAVLSVIVDRKAGTLDSYY